MHNPPKLWLGVVTYCYLRHFAGRLTGFRSGLRKTNRVGKYRSAKHEIEAYGFTQNFGVRYGPYIYIVTMSLLGLTLVTLSQLTEYGEMVSKITPLAITVSALLLGYQQWRAARNETSMDKYYERLDKADQRLNAWPAARAMLSHFWLGANDQESYERSNYVWVELDNLEYVIEKYKLGYINPDQALRALRTFRSRCMSPEFRALALEFVQSIENAGYYPTTGEVVKQVCRDFVDGKPDNAG